MRVCVCLCFTPCGCRSSSSRNRAVSSRETSPPRPQRLRARSSPLPRISCLLGGAVLCALRRQEGRERGPLGYAEDFFLLQNALKGAEVLAYIQLHTSVNLSLCSAPKPHASNPPKSHSRRSRGQDKATPRAGRLKKNSDKSSFLQGKSKYNGNKSNRQSSNRSSSFKPSLGLPKRIGFVPASTSHS